MINLGGGGLTSDAAMALQSGEPLGNCTSNECLLGLVNITALQMSASDFVLKGYTATPYLRNSKTDIHP